jgi:hypothetical protein
VSAAVTSSAAATSVLHWSGFSMMPFLPGMTLPSFS